MNRRQVDLETLRGLDPRLDASLRRILGTRRYIRAANGMRVPTNPIYIVGGQNGPANWLCRDCGLGFIRLRAAKNHRDRAHPTEQT